jgi:diguanylate cyclase (GGDEF)-like protein/PAS domain S-box-containing protein
MKWTQWLFGKTKDINPLNQKHPAIANQLYQHANLFDAIFHHTNVGIALLSLEGNFLQINKLMMELLGYGEEDIYETNLFHLLPHDDLKNIRTNIKKLLDKNINSFHIEQQFIQKNKEILWVLLTFLLICDEKNQPVCFIIQMQNISLQKKAEERLRHMAYHDSLTGLANRRRLQQFANQIIASSKRHQQDFALLFLDLDRFKNINDSIGHDAGDTILQIIADRLRNLVRSNDLVARLGGDEFVMLITDIKKTESVALIAQKILARILEVIVINGQEIYLTTSIGIVMYPYNGQNMQTLLRHADLALYRAKEQGKNNYQFYTLEMTAKAQEKMALQTALGHALTKNEFMLHYQPKMDIKSHKITGVEAFLRWKNSEYSSIPPEEIIALAEETGLIVPVSDWIIRTACKQLKIWHDMGFNELTMAINCSSRQFKQAGFFENLLQIITQTDLSPGSLEVEVTESMIMQNPEIILRVLYSLKDLGIKIVIDDFGTGYWSLSNLKKLTIDKIKIDKTFIKQIQNDETSRAIVIAMIAMGHKLGITSIAEGVENAEQFDFLAREGCIEIQGYYMTPPLTDIMMTHFLYHPVLEGEAKVARINLEE